MPRKIGKDIALGLRKGDIGADEAHEWLTTSNAKELQGYLRWLGAVEPTWSQFGRDALNVVLANENIKLQTDIRYMTDKMKRMTQWVTVLTIIIAFLTFVQAYPIIKTFFNCSKSSVNIQKPENATNQPTETNQITTKNNDALSKTKTINHK